MTRARPSSEAGKLYLPEGALVGRYRILCPIASGGMATVYAAHLVGEERFQRPVALKLMLPHLVAEEQFVTMFIDEANTAAAIRSPYAVATFDMGRHEDQLYIAMELVIGPSLRDIIRRHGAAGAPLDVAVSVLHHAARGLHDAHEATDASGTPLEIVHRDVSPHNVLVGADGHARVADFGIARALNRRTKTSTGELKGKLAYMAPEQLLGQADRRSDVFALGVVAWETFTGARLFQADHPFATMRAINTAEIARPDELRKDLPPRIADAVMKALSREPAERFSTALELAEALAPSAPLTHRQLAAYVRESHGDAVRKLESRIAAAVERTQTGIPLPGVLEERPPASRSDSFASIAVSASSADAEDAVTTRPAIAAWARASASTANRPWGRLVFVAAAISVALALTAWVYRAQTRPAAEQPVAQLADETARSRDAAEPHAAGVAVDVPAPAIEDPADDEPVSAATSDRAPRATTRRTSRRGQGAARASTPTSTPTSTQASSASVGAETTTRTISTDRTGEPEEPSRTGRSSGGLLFDVGEFRRELGGSPSH